MWIIEKRYSQPIKCYKRCVYILFVKICLARKKIVFSLKFEKSILPPLPLHEKGISTQIYIRIFRPPPSPPWERELGHKYISESESETKGKGVRFLGIFWLESVRRIGNIDPSGGYLIVNFIQVKKSLGISKREKKLSYKFLCHAYAMPPPSPNVFCILGNILHEYFGMESALKYFSSQFLVKGNCELHPIQFIRIL